MQVAYIAGAYRAPTLRGVEENVRIAAVYANLVTRCGHAVVCPHTNSHMVDAVHSMPDEYWLAADIDIMLRSDFLVMIPGWQRSAGAVNEDIQAKAHGIKVYYHIKDIPGFTEFKKSQTITDSTGSQTYTPYMMHILEILYR